MVLLAVELGSESGPGVLHLLHALCDDLHFGLQSADNAVSCQSGSLCLGHAAPKQVVLAGQPVCCALEWPTLCCAVLCCAVLCCAVLCCCSMLRCADMPSTWASINCFDAWLQVDLLKVLFVETQDIVLLFWLFVRPCHAVHKHACTHVKVTLQKWFCAVAEMS